MKLTETMSDQIFRHLRILQRLTWLQTIVLGVAGLGFLMPHSQASVQLVFVHSVSYPVWLLGVAGVSTIYGIPALWWAFKQIDLDGFTYSRWVNWHAAVLTLCVLFVFILGPSNPGVALIGAFAGVLYGVVSATVISRISQRLSQDNSHKGEATQNVQVTRRETLVLAQDEVKTAESKSENWRKQIWKKPIPHLRYVFWFLMGLPLLLPFILPLHPLDGWPALQAYVGWMAGIVPAVAKFSTMDSPYGQLAATVDALIVPPVLAACLYLWPYILIPLWRAEKKLCTSFYGAVLSANRARAEVIAIERGKPPSSKKNIYVIFGLVMLWVALSDLGLIPQGAPMFGPIAANGLFIYALKNRFYMSFISWTALIAAMSAYAFIPLFLIGQLICHLKPDPMDSRPNPSA
jgi:succinate dehydrogenase hydrophobic anchor subunit